MSHVMCHVSCVNCHMSHVTCHVSHVKCQQTKKFDIKFFLCKKKLDNVMELVGGGSVINEADPV